MFASYSQNGRHCCHFSKVKNDKFKVIIKRTLFESLFLLKFGSWMQLEDKRTLFFHCDALMATNCIAVDEVSNVGFPPHNRGCPSHYKMPSVQGLPWWCSG